MTAQQNQTTSLIKNINIEDFLKQNATQFKSVLPKHFDIRKLFRLTVTEIRKNPDLLKCTTESLIGALLECAQVGLEIGNRKAYLVPYKRNLNLGTKTNPRWSEIYECQFQPGYQGLIELALRSGKILKIYAQPVFSNDYFYIEYGTNERLEHKPALGERGDFIGSYSIAKFITNGGDEYQFEFMTKSEIDEIMARSPSSSSKYSPWKTDYYEMSRKTPTKKLCKYLPSSSDMEIALTIDDKEQLAEKGIILDLSPENNETKTEKLKRNLETQKAQNIVNAALNPEQVPAASNLDTAPVNNEGQPIDQDWVDDYDKTQPA